MDIPPQTNPPLSRIGCAGWSLRSEHQSLFPEAGTHLERYASVFHAVEVNSCFYRSHRKATWMRWAESTPQSFRFSYKLPKSITHVARLRNAHDALCTFFDEVDSLGNRLGVLLVQLPPSLEFDAHLVDEFYSVLRRVDDRRQVRRAVACEPRHPSWFTPQANKLLDELEVAGVAAHPPRPGQNFQPYGFGGLNYFRLHGAPRIYYSAYIEAELQALKQQIIRSTSSGTETWCIFDNTAEGHAVNDALRLMQLLESGQ